MVSLVIRIAEVFVVLAMSPFLAQNLLGFLPANMSALC